jgi:hypothetical protein
VAATINVLLQGSEIVLLSPPVERWLDPKLHSLTGLWNVQELVAYLLFLVGMFMMTFMTVSRLSMTDRQLAKFVRQWLVRPATLCIPVTVAIFVYGGVGRVDTPDLVLTHQTLGIRAFWMSLVVAVTYLMMISGQALLVVRRDPTQRRAANAYLAAVAASGATTLAIASNVNAELAWYLIRVETLAHALATGYAWRDRARYLRGCHS